MALDVKRLLDDARAKHKNSSISAGPGTVDAIRKALPQIRVLRMEGVRWRTIAEALSAQGMTQGKGEKQRPIETTRLTAIVAKLDRQEQTQNDRRVRRAERPDIARPSPEEPKAASTVRLSSELSVISSRATPSTNDVDEEEIRRRNLAAIQPFLRTDY